MRQTDTPARDDREALYQEVVAGMAPALARLAAGFEADPHAREDLMQEMHLRIWRSLNTFDSTGDLRAWAWRVAHNTAADHVARAVRRKPAQLSETGEIDGVERRPGPAAITLARERAERLLAQIRALPPADRHIIVLYLEGEPPRSIAELTGLSPGAVSVRLHRLRAALADGIRKGEDA